MKVLVVDDDRNIIRYYKEELEDEGYEVVIADTGKKALELFEKESPDIVTLDILMPDIDGISLLRQMKEQRPKTPIIMSTAYDYRDDFAIWASDLPVTVILYFFNFCNISSVNQQNNICLLSVLNDA
jgi:CheY-like chemotaxis protein